MKKTILLPMLLFAFIVLFPLKIHAGTVPPSGPYGSDVENINYELATTGYARLEKGKTYYLSYFISLNSNNTINATGATIIVNHGAARNHPDNYKTGYNSMSNVKIIGGTWLPEDKNGCEGTTFSFAHCSNITLSKMDIRCTNAEGHAIELVGCKNVTISNCKVIARGKSSSKSVEEMIQIDLAAPHTAPFLTKKFQNGLPCRDITITGCTVTGCRGICANYPNKDKKYKKKYHRNIVIKNCRITGNTSEALALFNTIDVIVQKNTIITKSKRTKQPYSIGCHVALFGTIPAFSKGTVKILNNTIKGGRQGFQICSHSKTRYGKLIIKNNKLYCKKAKKDAMKVAYNNGSKPSVVKVTEAKNKLFKWK